MKVWKKLLVVCLAAIAVFIVVAGLILARLEWEASLPHADCTSIYFAALEQWMMENKQTNYPNVEGDSSRSFLALHEFIKGDPRPDYAYIPGLRETDPPDLILLYMNRRAKSQKPGDYAPLYKLPKLKWLAIPHKWSGPHCERGEWLETDEFKQRIRKTLDFLKENKRPNWERIVKEHEPFLETINE